MIKDWHDTFAPSQEVAEFEKLLSSCLLVFNLSIIIGIDLLEVWQLEHQLLTENTPSKDKTYEAICTLLLTHVARYPFADLDKEYFEQTQLPYLAHLLYLETQMNTPPTVSVYIQTTIQYRTKQMIETRIHSIYSKASVTFINQMEAADLLITDSYEEVIFSEKLVLLSNLQAEQEWAAVFAKINQLMMTKMPNKESKLPIPFSSQKKARASLLELFSYKFIQGLLSEEATTRYTVHLTSYIACFIRG